MSEIKIGSWMYHQTQINGERITTNVSFKACLMADQNPSEIVINGIPFFMREDDLIPLFETIGIVAQFRLMMHVTGSNRGYGFMIYAESNDTYRAIAQLKNILLSSICTLKLSISKNTLQLWLTKVSYELDIADVIDLIVEKVDPEEISVSEQNDCHRRRFVLKFLTHRVAALARQKLVREMLDFGVEAQANWDNPE